MSLEKLVLNPLNITTLYKNSLVHVPSKNSSTDANEKQAIVYKGEHVKKVTVLVYETQYPFLADSDFELLTKIIGACGLTINDIALINMHQQKLNIQKINADLKPAFVIMFGVTSTDIDLPLIFQQYKSQQFANTNFIAAHHLYELAKDANLRKSLWECLKVMFNK